MVLVLGIQPLAKSFAAWSAPGIRWGDGPPTLADALKDKEVLLRAFPGADGRLPSRAGHGSSSSATSRFGAVFR